MLIQYIMWLCYLTGDVNTVYYVIMLFNGRYSWETRILYLFVALFTALKCVLLSVIIAFFDNRTCIIVFPMVIIS